MVISSRSNATVKRIRKLRARPERERSGLFFIEGVRVVAEAIQLGAAIEEIVLAPDLLRSEFALELVREQEERGIPVLAVSGDVFATLSLKERPQGVGAVARERWETLDEVRPGAGLCWVALDAVADPGNLGTILRTSEAVGGSGVILLGRTTDPYDPSAVRASMGAVFSQRLVRADAASLGEWARRHDVAIAGTSPEGSVDYQAARYPHPLVLLMGSERQGLPPEYLELCDLLVHIPMAGRSDSLNLAVATGVVLYEIFNQRRHAGNATRPRPVRQSGGRSRQRRG